MTDTAKFDVHLKLKAVDGGDGPPRIQAVASSTSVDLGGDKFSLSALRSMAAQMPSVPIMTDHRYSAAEGNVFGRCVSANVTPRGGRHDLDCVIEVSQSNPKAVMIFGQVKEGIPLGLSVGCVVEDARKMADGGLEITSCKLLEVSVTPLPANRDAWISGAVKAASAWFTQRSETGKTAPERLQALQAALTIEKLLRLHAEAERDEYADQAGQLVAALDEFLDTPLPRKIRPETVAKLEQLSEAYPHLHPAIISTLAAQQTRP